MKALSMIDIIETAKQAIAILAGLGIVVDMTPGIELQPVRWIIKQLGNLMNHDMEEKLEALQKDFTEHKVESWRYEILDFANSCMNHRQHTKEEFDHIIDVHNKYDTYIKDKEIENGQIDLAYNYISEIYIKLLKENGFLSGDPEKEEGI